MTQTKLNKKLQEFLERFGNIVIIKLIDYYYQENYEGSVGWKVREELTIQDVIDLNPNPVDYISLSGLTGRDLVEFLAKWKGKPYEAQVTYDDSYELYKKRKAEHRDEERKKYLAFCREVDRISGGIPVRNFYLPEKTTIFSTKRGKRRK